MSKQKQSKIFLLTGAIFIIIAILLIVSYLTEISQKDYSKLFVTKEKVLSDAEVSNLNDDNWQLKIDAIGVVAPIVFDVDGNDETAYLEALKAGVAMLAGSELDEQGVVIFGHSSSFWWDEGKYKEVFAKFDRLEKKDQIQIYSDKQQYKYELVNEEIIESDDVELIETYKKQYDLILMTCYPVGTTNQRLIVLANKIN